MNEYSILLDNSDSDIKTIYHIADIHIRQLKRHEEYKSVFSNLYKEIQKQGTDNAVLVVVGDILHSKNELSPELIEMTVVFFYHFFNVVCKRSVSLKFLLYYYSGWKSS